MQALNRLTRLLALDLRSFSTRRLPARDAYTVWADTYPAHPHNPLMKAEQAAMAPIVEAAAPVRALDAGTGTGRNLGLLRRAGARTVVGIDLSPAMLGRRSSTDPLVCGDAGCLPFPDRTFDLVCASLMVGDIQEPGTWIREAARVLAPGGHLVYSDFHPAWSAERWRRTFRSTDGRRFELPYLPHTIDDHLGPIDASRLMVRTIREPRVAGRVLPVVVVFHAVKPGRLAVARRRP